MLADTMPLKAPSPVSHPPLGTLVDDDSLELVEVLGIGGYGVVYRAVDTRSSFPKSYAVKCLVDPLPQQNGRQRHIHIREITLHQLASAHPNVVTLHRVIEDYNYTYIVMDYASDGDLFSQILHSCRYLGDDHLIKQVFLQLLDAVEYCHSLGIYHRDLKPENVLCFDGGLRVAITDFGLATTDKVSEEFRTGSVYHMSPECQGGEFAPTGSYSPMSNDIWSLAIILLNLATGRNPWKSASASDPTFQAYLQDPASFLPTVLPISPELNAILVRMLEVDWRDRMTLPVLRRAIQEVDNFYADGVIFEGSMARCPWEAGMEIDSDSSTKGESDSRDELKSRWSKDSASESDIVFASQSTTEESSYERWTAYSSCAATWGFESPMSSSDSQRMLASLRMWDPPQTPPSTRSPQSPSFGSTPSLPATPNGTDASFGGRVDIVPQKQLTLDTNCGRLRQNGSQASLSSRSSTMQTAIEYIPYSSSFFLASPGSPSKASLEMPSTVDFGDNEENKEMDSVSTWEYAATDMSYPSIYARTKSSLACQDIVCDIKSPTVLCPDIINWPDFHLQPTFVTQCPELLQPVSACSDNCSSSPVSKITPRSPSKKSYEAKSKGARIFKFFPRSPRSSSSLSRGSTLARSRTPSPPLKQPWTFVPSRPRTPLSTQDSNCRRTGGLTSKRYWFSPGKLFSASAS